MRLRSAKALTIIELSIQLISRPGIELTLNEALNRA